MAAAPVPGPAPAPAAAPQGWLIVTSPDNFEISRDRGFDMAGVKAVHREAAKKLAPGDRVAFYVTKIEAFAATATALTPALEQRDPVIWRSREPNEVYPFRFAIRVDAVCPPGRYVPAETLLDSLEFVQKWPREHWRLAFQGNLHHLPLADLERIRRAIQALAAGAAPTRSP